MSRSPNVKIVNPSDLDARALAEAESHQLLRPYDPGIPWDQGGRELAERIIRTTANIAGECMIQMGQVLIHAKNACGHGNFGPFLEANGISAASAARAMRMAKRWSNLGSLKSLPRTKAYHLLALDDDDLAALDEGEIADWLRRDQIEDMTAGQLAREVREYKRRDEKAKEELKAERERRVEAEDALRRRDHAEATDADTRIGAAALAARAALDRFCQVCRADAPQHPRACSAAYAMLSDALGEARLAMGGAFQAGIGDQGPGASEEAAA